LKLDNILISKVDDQNNYDVKIADFGLAVELPKYGLKIQFEKCGTPSNIAPEIFSGNGYDT
jgi:serine/threonine protein kinase